MSQNTSNRNKSDLSYPISESKLPEGHGVLAPLAAFGGGRLVHLRRMDDLPSPGAAGEAAATLGRILGDEGSKDGETLAGAG